MRPRIADRAVGGVNASLGYHPDAAAAVLDGGKPLFAVRRRQLSPQRLRFLRTTNAIEKPVGLVRATRRGVKNARQAETNERRGAAGDGETTESR